MFLLTDAFQYFGPKLAMYIARLEFYTTYSSCPPASARCSLSWVTLGTRPRRTASFRCSCPLLLRSLWTCGAVSIATLWMHRLVLRCLHLCGPISKESYELRCRVDLRQHRTDYRLVLHIDTPWSACCFLHQILLVPSVAMSSWPPRERLNVSWCDFCCCCCCNWGTVHFDLTVANFSFDSK